MSFFYIINLIKLKLRIVIYWPSKKCYELHTDNILQIC